jgi:hypothetical protein
MTDDPVGEPMHFEPLIHPASAFMPSLVIAQAALSDNGGFTITELSQGPQQFVEDAHVVAVGDGVVQSGRNQHELAASQDWLCEVTHARGHPVPSLPATASILQYTYLCARKNSQNSYQLNQQPACSAGA